MTDINQVAMEVIMNACTGRDKVDQAIACMAYADFKQAEALLEEAEQDILKAHVAQTRVIQSQAAGEDAEYSLLFIHAQDTIMTSNSELRVVKNLLPLFINQNKQIELLKGGNNND